MIKKIVARLNYFLRTKSKVWERWRSYEFYVGSPGLAFYNSRLFLGSKWWCDSSSIISTGWCSLTHLPFIRGWNWIRIIMACRLFLLQHLWACMYPKNVSLYLHSYFRTLYYIPSNLTVHVLDIVWPLLFLITFSCCIIRQFLAWWKIASF